MIDSNSVDQACLEVNGYTEDRMMEEFQEFFREQPSICEFVTELTGESSMQIQELSLFLSYMVFKAVNKGQSTQVQPVTPESIEAAYRESEMWIDRINQGDAPPELPADSEPYLIQYVISELNQPLEDGTLLEDEQKGEVFFVLRTVISSLTRRPRGKEV